MGEIKMPTPRQVLRSYGANIDQKTHSDHVTRVIEKMKTIEGASIITRNYIIARNGKVTKIRIRRSEIEKWTKDFLDISDLKICPFAIITLHNVSLLFAVDHTGEPMLLTPKGRIKNAELNEFKRLVTVIEKIKKSPCAKLKAPKQKEWSDDSGKNDLKEKGTIFMGTTVESFLAKR